MEPLLDNGQPGRITRIEATAAAAAVSAAKKWEEHTAQSNRLNLVIALFLGGLIVAGSNGILNAKAILHFLTGG